MLRDQIDVALRAALKMKGDARLVILRLMNAAVRDRDILCNKPALSLYLPALRCCDSPCIKMVHKSHF
ncbi:hypothetical protein [Bartonella rattimassiliensis]|uniref:Uncharacterized protein n=2 Tax=Bartonella rattimassiliensis TaxID=270250 RepID=J1JFZ8_9HYPH|nr:hypothetical protein [Bartonella rattimassiliensis]EJF83050.1 hypothetical protein MCY_01571 [Bartonella rattimassiliensis 15908]